jgi:hypothetical protein
MFKTRWSCGFWTLLRSDFGFDFGFRVSDLVD